MDARKPDKSCWDGSASSDCLNRSLIDNGIDQAIADSLMGRHEEVSVGVLLDAIQGLPGAIGQLVV